MEKDIEDAFINTNFRITFCAIILLIIIGACAIIMIDVITNKPNSTLSYKDNIENPANKEFLNEIKFNRHITSEEEAQLEFCWRYYDTLDDSSKEWFKNNLD